MRQDDNMRTAAQVLLDQLRIHGVTHVFCVPGESYLAVLDAFRYGRINRATYWLLLAFGAAVYAVIFFYSSKPIAIQEFVLAIAAIPRLHDIGKSAWAASCLSRPTFKWYIPAAVAPPIQIYCRSRTFLERQETLLDGPLESLSLYGLPVNLRDLPVAYAEYESKLPSVPPRGLLGT